MIESQQLIPILQLTIGCVFGASCVAKIISFREFVVALAEYGLSSRVGAFYAALGLIVVEVVISVSHLSGWQMRIVSMGTVVLMGVFAIVTVRKLLSGAAATCLCFGVSGNSNSAETLTRLSLLIIAEIALLLSAASSETSRSPVSLGQDDLQWVVLSTLLMALAAFYMVRLAGFYRLEKPRMSQNS